MLTISLGCLTQCAKLQRDQAQSKRGVQKDVALVPQATTRPRPSRRPGRIAAQHITQKRGAQGASRLPAEGDSRLTWVSDSELSEQGGAQLVWEGGTERSWESDTEFIEDGGSEFTEENDAWLTDHANLRPPTGVTPGLQKRVTQGLHNVEAIQVEQNRGDDSNHISPGEKTDVPWDRLAAGRKPSRELGSKASQGPAIKGGPKPNCVGSGARTKSYARSATS
jgi:hypothetical protein